MSGAQSGVLADLAKERSLARLRDLQPIPRGLEVVLHAIGSPLLWVGLFVLGALVFGIGQDPFTAKLSTAILLVGVAGLYGAARVISRDLAEDRRPLPGQYETDRELQRVVERLTRNGAPIRVAHADVIAAYIVAHYGP